MTTSKVRQKWAKTYTMRMGKYIIFDEKDSYPKSIFIGEVNKIDIVSHLEDYIHVLVLFDRYRLNYWNYKALAYSPLLIYTYTDCKSLHFWLWHWTDMTAYCLFGCRTAPIRLCVGGISDPPLTDYCTCPIKYLNWGLLWVMQTLDDHGHFGGYNHLLFDRLKHLIDIMGITDNAWFAL